MRRVAIDAETGVRLAELAEEGVEPPEECALVAPRRLLSDALDLLYGQVARGERDRDEAIRLADRLTTMRVRLLGDRVSRAAAWRIAEELDRSALGDAEYLAVATLQADALVAADPALAADAAARGIRTVPLDRVLDPRPVG